MVRKMDYVYIVSMKRLQRITEIMKNRIWKEHQKIYCWYKRNEKKEKKLYEIK